MGLNWFSLSKYFPLRTQLVAWKRTQLLYLHFSNGIYFILFYKDTTFEFLLCPVLNLIVVVSECFDRSTCISQKSLHLRNKGMVRVKFRVYKALVRMCPQIFLEFVFIKTLVPSKVNIRVKDQLSLHKCLKF